MPSLHEEVPLRPLGTATVLDSDALLLDPGRPRRAVFAWLEAESRCAGASLIVGLESWGYLFAAPTAVATGVGLATARRRVERLGADAVVASYDTNDDRQRHIGIEPASVGPGARAVLIDDTVVSGGTLGAVARLVRTLGGEVVGALSVVGNASARDLVERAIDAPLSCYRWVP
jgi:adenine/guanine phosphoribosyltransferase-like PRPP-binding protein